jgi:hypothetical protein
MSASNGKSSAWFEHLVGPLVVGLVVLIGQFFLQPQIAVREHSQTHHWEAKRDCYVKCLNLVNKKFLSLMWLGEHSQLPYPLGTPPTAEEVNQCYAELSLFAESGDSIRLFIKCFGQSSDKTIKLDDRVQLIHAMRKDLGFDPIVLNPEDVKLFVVP